MRLVRTLRPTTGLLVLFLAAGGAACATWGGIDEPEVQVTRVRPVSAGLLEQEFRLGLRIHNPNPFALQVVGLRYELEAGGEALAAGVEPLRRTIPAYGEEELEVRARAETLQMLRGAGGLGSSGLSYSIEGKLLLDQPEADDVAFAHTTRGLDLD